MRVQKRFGLMLAAVVFAVTLMPSMSWASTVKNCPQEPTSTTIASGIDYAGTNCVLHTPGDIDSFVFGANNRDTYQIIVAYQGGFNGTCMKLFDPNGKLIFPNSSNPNNCTGNVDLVVSQALTVTGNYTINLSTEGNGSGGDYALSLERINPLPPDAQQLTLRKAVNGTFAPANQQITYTFFGSTTGTYQVSVNYTGGFNGTCVYLYYPGSAMARPAPDQGCTGNGVFQFTFQPPTNGTYMVLLTGEGDGSGGDYSIEVSCFLGTCSSPPCTLIDAASYNATTSTLTMKFTIGNNLGEPAIWNAWLTYADPQGTSLDTMQPLFSVSQPITNPPKVITKTFGLPKEGTVGILSTLSTTKNGIACSSWVQVTTGTDPLSP
jgi:hypothetical protein